MPISTTAANERRFSVKTVPCGIDGCTKMFFKSNTVRKKHIRRAHPDAPKLLRGKSQEKSILLFKHQQRRAMTVR